MATIQFEITEEDRERFARQAEREGMALGAWLITIARRHVDHPVLRQTAPRFETADELRAYLRDHSGLDGPERELDWEEHLHNLNASIRKGLPEV